MASYKDLLAQRDNLERQIAEARQRETADAVAKVRAIVAEYGLTASEVFGKSKSAKTNSRSKVAPKYKNAATGETWTGRGKTPKWLAGKDKNKFLIA